ncbi:MAG TPA: hypothetical protein VEF04_18905 [Blastocatellia bacterium]|nr:hypothetical protein [Blastocatellia bacterium]
MADVEKAAQHEHEEFDFEHQEPKNNLIALLLISSCAALIIIVVLLQWFFDFTREARINATGNVKFEEVERYRADENQKLTTYKYIDKEKDVVQIPVTRAMQLIAEEAKSGQPKYAQAITGGVTASSAAPSASPAASPAAKAAAAAGQAHGADAGAGQKH